MGGVTMRVTCKNYESRTYPSGDTVRQCRLDLAPEAPWRCPAECPAFQPRLADAGWAHGSLAPTPPDQEPELDEDAISMLDAAEDVINAIGPQTVSEVNSHRDVARREAERRRAKPRRWWWPF